MVTAGGPRSWLVACGPIQAATLCGGEPAAMAGCWLQCGGLGAVFNSVAGDAREPKHRIHHSHPGRRQVSAPGQQRTAPVVLRVVLILV